MHSVFINREMDWQPKDKEWWVRLTNSMLKAANVPAKLVSPHGFGSMTNTEQRMNLFHLLKAALVYEVPGEIVDIGVLRGQTGGLFGAIVKEFAPERRVHGYDTLSGGDAQIAEIKANFASIGAAPPILYKGLVQDTLPAQLPEQISFASIDIGSPENKDISGSVKHCLESVYPRMARGAVCVVQDYCDKSVADTWDPWPQVKQGVDAFLSDKPERMAVPYAAHYSHGYFRKL